MLNTGTASTNVFLRRVHDFALDPGWLPWPVVVKRQSLAIEFKRAVGDYRLRTEAANSARNKFTQ